MRNKLYIQYLSILLLVFLFAIGSVYANSDLGSQTLDWANKKTIQAQDKIQTSLLESVQSQIKRLDVNNDKKLEASTTILSSRSKAEIQETSNSINEKLEGYRFTMDEAYKSIELESDHMTKDMITRLNHRIANRLFLFGSEDELKLKENMPLTIDTRGLEQKSIQAARNLAEEIRLTEEAIENLLLEKELEQNEVIKAFIQEKVDELQRILMLMKVD